MDYTHMYTEFYIHIFLSDYKRVRYNVEQNILMQFQNHDYFILFIYQKLNKSPKQKRFVSYYTVF